MKNLHFIWIASMVYFCPLWPASFPVTTSADSGAGSFRQAILNLNASADATNTITINVAAVGGPILLASDLPVLQKSVAISTTGGTQVIDGNAKQYRLLAATASLSVQNCTLQNGAAIGGIGIGAGGGGGGGLGAGGAIYVAPANSLTLIDAIIQNNIAQGGKGGAGSSSTSNKDGGGGGGASFSSANRNGNGSKGGGDNPGQSGFNSGGTGGANGGGNGGQETTPGVAGSGSGGTGNGGGKGGAGIQPAGLSGPGGGGGGGGSSSLGTGQCSAGGNGGAGGGGGGGGAHYHGGGGGGYNSGGGGGGGTDLEDHSGAGGGGGGYGGGGGGGGCGKSDATQAGGGGGGGGFGGGGGGAGANLSPIPFGGGLGGSYGGDGGYQSSTTRYIGAGGGGGGLGGAVFVSNGSTLIIQNSLSITGNQAIGGAAGTSDLSLSVAATNGTGFANDIFLYTGSKLVFDSTADISASFDIQSDPNSPADLGIIKQNTGKVTLSSLNNSYQGGVQINGGTLSISNDANLGSASVGISINGGTLESTATMSSSRVISLVGNGSIAVDPTYNFTILTGISGVGSLTKINGGTLTLKGTNTYMGGTQINGGILSISNDANLGNSSGGISFDGGTLEATATMSSSRAVTLIGNGTIAVDPTYHLTLSAGISGAGSLTKQDIGTLTLTGPNNYTGGTTVIDGTLSLSGAGTLAPSGAVTVNSGNFDISGMSAPSLTIGDLSGTGGFVVLGSKGLLAGTVNSTTYAGIIKGTGGLIKQGTGTLTLTGNNEYTGGSLIQEGAIQGSSNSLPGAFRIDSGTSLIFDQVQTGIQAGIISGTGSLVKQGSGTLTFLKDSSAFAGEVDVHAGVLLIQGKLGGDYTIFSGGRLGGTGTVGSVGSMLINNGIVSPGASIGTLTVSGDYTQGPEGELQIEINDKGGTDLLQVKGTATLDGTLHISPNPGIYLDGTTYTILTGSTVSGTFSHTTADKPVAGETINYTVNYFSSSVQLALFPPSVIILPVPNSALSGNAQSVAKYLFCPAFDFGNADLVAVGRALIHVPAEEYPTALATLAPTPYSALPLSELESNFNLANTFFVAGEGQRSSCYTDERPMSLWMSQLGFGYAQKGRQQSPGFDANAYGAAIGFDRLLGLNWTVGAGIGYSHSHLHWKQHAGRANANSAYLGPYVKYDSEYIYLDFLLLGAGNFYDIDRKIQFPGLLRKAHSTPTTWNLSEIFLIGGRVAFPQTEQFFIQPEVLLDQMNVFQGNVKEKGAGSINLCGKSKYAAFLRSLVNVKFVKEWTVSHYCLVPSINAGWLRTTPLTNGRYTAKFCGLDLCQPNFTVSSFHKTIDQALVGAQLLVSHQDNFDFSLSYNGQFGNGTHLNEGNVTLRWKF